MSTSTTPPGMDNHQRDSEAGPHRIHHAYTTQSPAPNSSIAINLPDDEHTKIRRAAKACANCRKHKLRCLGGEPCRRCQRAGILCDFSGKPAPMPNVGSVASPSGSAPAGNATVTNARVTALESSVTQILGHLEALRDELRPLERLVRPDVGARFDEQMRPTGVRLDREGSRYPSQESRYPAYEQATDRSRIDQLAMAAAQQSPVLNIPANEQHASTSFELAPINGSNTMYDPQRRDRIQLPSFTGPSPPESASQSVHSRLSLRDLAPPPTDPDITPSSRLRDATMHRFDPPFRAISFNPRVWENREIDPALSRVSSEDARRGEGEAMHPMDPFPASNTRKDMGGESISDDPIANGILSERMAWALFQQYAEHVHPFMPVCELSNLFAFYETTRGQSSFLFSVILAISARFCYRKAAAQTAGAPSSMLEVDAQTFDELADAAESHLARTLLRKQHAVTDVQGTLLMATWGLRSGGGGPDAWILTGHAFRMSRRLGMHLDDAVYAREKHLWIGEQGQRRVERYITRRRVWLALSVYDCLFSLGFGRPPSQPQMDAAETGAFLNLIMARFEQSGGRATLQEPGGDRIAAAVTGDVFIACQVELLQIARDFRAEIDQMRDNVEAQAVLNRTPGDGLTSAILTMCSRLNQRLDQWEERWSPKTPIGQFLRPIASHVQLCVAHIRLCINATALQPLSSRPSTAVSAPQPNAARQLSPQEEACLGIAINAAVNVIRLHRDSVATPGMAFSYGTDYISCSLAHAALFLICAWKQGAKIDRGLVHHSLIQAIDAADYAERSHTRLLTALGRRIRELAVEAGFTDVPPSATNEETSRGPGQKSHARSILNVDSDLQIPVEMDFNGHMGSWFPGDGGFSWQ